MPKDILTIAGAINVLYNKIYGYSSEDSDMTEMKMHKILYFAQKQHYNNFGKWLFNEDFKGWVHGPINRKTRNAMNYSMLPEVTYEDLTLEEEYTIREVIHDYGQFSAYQLKGLSHQESAYKKSRAGLSEKERGNRTINKVDIIDDIAKEQEKSTYS